ncbi:RecJ [Desulfamplus magnetovallimortis]|uniref:Single-stranded-DNA-specific exonuclease RecJ n=1 Tax=Desulfamplus magnetovallimortis TaxID=1246637 RepID=A0A1W1HKJ8_9BACT|nr:single-stranded-DNA-specific exonuclease RecJ [Desulfamplus magnetovallimortis]SLM33004.1 RecJ [Desulfamplus magnetovallimortis]
METEWLIPDNNPDIAEKIARIVGCHKIVAKILVNRGVLTPEEAFTFLNPSFTNLTDPFALKDMKKAVQRIYTAICNREKILVFGDFDADGITATSLLNDFFYHVEAEVSWYVPHRVKEGFSLKPCHIEMAAEQKCDLVITVDCGSDSHDAVKLAIKEDIDVIITDHHEVTSHIPPAIAVVNPKREDCQAGLEHLAGVGVAFYLIIALRQHLRINGFWKDIQEPNLIKYCDLFAIGTIADMVPLKAENRILSRAGMEIIQQGKREGIRALTKISRIESGFLNSDDISFRIAPRINAAGRISHARICVDLLTEKNRIKAEQTAAILDNLNTRRQLLEKSIVDDIEYKIKIAPELLNASAIVMASPEWPAGVMGIAASRISRSHCRPVILISTAQEPATGSCRSINRINIHKALCACCDLLENFGGHAMAAGITINKENIESFKHLFESEIAKASSDKVAVKTINLDSSLDIEDITESFIEEIEALRPFGTGNPEPMFECMDLKVVSSMIMGTRHRKMVLQKCDSPGGKKACSIEALQFNIDPEEPMQSKFKKIAFRVRMNRFNKRKIPQIIIEEAL